MKKQSKLMLGILIGIILIVSFALLFFFFKPIGQAVLPSTGCKLIINQNNPNNITKIIDSNSDSGGLTYTCQTGSECIVYGKMTVEKLTGTNIIQCVSSGCTNPITFTSLSQCQNTATRCGSGTCTSQNCELISSSEYKADFNFCPSEVSFDYCDGSNSIVIGNSVFQTNEYKLSGNAQQSISFNPKYSDNTFVAKKTLFINEYDCTCLAKIQSQPTKYCNPSEDKKLCTSTTGYQTCSGTENVCDIFANTNYCSPGQYCYLDSTGRTGFGIGQCKCPSDTCTEGSLRSLSGDTTGRYYEKCVRGSSGVCAETSWIADSCTEGLKFDSLTKKCIGQSECSPQDAECLGTQQIKGCQEVRINDKLCIAGTCIFYKWNTQIVNCGTNKVCQSINNAPDQCICSNECAIGTVQCIDSSKYRDCSKDPSDSISCRAYRDLGSKVELGQICDVGTNTIKTSSGCRWNNPSCSSGKTCIFSSSNPSDNGICQDIGCSYETSGYECSTQTDTNGAKLEFCNNNVCSATADSNSAIEVDYQKTRCDTVNKNLVQKANRYSINYRGTSYYIYRWETYSGATDSTSGVCNSGFRCGLDGTNARCISENEFMIIRSLSNYAVGTKLTNISVELTTKVPDRTNVPITAILKDKETGASIVGARVDTFTNTKGIALISFTYTPQKTQDLLLEVSVKNKADTTKIEYSGSKTITIAKTLDVKLNCPSQFIINREAKCTFTVEDIDTGEIVSVPIIEVTVKQGIDEIDYLTTTSAITFTPTKVGSVTITLKATKESYNPATSVQSVSIQSPKVSQTLLVDSKPLSDYDLTGITTGSHSISLAFTESGISLDVDSIEATVLTPSGASNIVTFTESQGKWSASVPLTDKGQTYVISGFAYPSDISKSVIPFEYSISTVKSTTEDLGTQINWIIIGIIGFVVVVGVVIVLAFIGRKKKQ